VHLEGRSNVRWLAVTGIGLLIAVVLGGDLRAATALPSPPSNWAVLIEHNSFSGRYPDLPVAYANSTRMLTVLTRRGWSPDHILLLRNDLDPMLLQHSVGWLAARVRPGDTALLYVASEYQWLDGNLGWDLVIPPIWKNLRTSRRVLIAEACFAQRLADAVRGIPGLALPAVGRDELDWWGVRETGKIMRGAPFTYFLGRALAAQPEGAPLDFAAAFPEAVAGAREYFRTVIATTPGALNSFHDRGSHPERLARFPNPHLVGGDETVDPELQAASAP
jgi:hypothetical protein